MTTVLLLSIVMKKNCVLYPAMAIMLLFSPGSISAGAGGEGGRWL